MFDIDIETCSECGGDISIYWFDLGWIWMIHLRDDIMSIGAVSYPEHFRTRSGSLDEFLLGTLEGLTETKQRMEKAEAIMPAQATGNYSYLSDRMCGPGYLLVGDAFAFIDPVLSSGVYLAMISMLAGDVFSNRQVRRRLLVFKAIYSVSWLLNWREAYAARKIRLTNLKSEAQRPAA